MKLYYCSSCDLYFYSNDGFCLKCGSLCDDQVINELSHPLNKPLGGLDAISSLFSTDNLERLHSFTNDKIQLLDLEKNIVHTQNIIDRIQSYNDFHEFSDGLEHCISFIESLFIDGFCSLNESIEQSFKSRYKKILNKINKKIRSVIKKDYSLEEQEFTVNHKFFYTGQFKDEIVKLLDEFKEINKIFLDKASIFFLDKIERESRLELCASHKKRITNNEDFYLSFSSELSKIKNEIENLDYFDASLEQFDDFNKKICFLFIDLMTYVEFAHEYNFFINGKECSANELIDTLRFAIESSFINDLSYIKDANSIEEIKKTKNDVAVVNEPDFTEKSKTPEISEDFDNIIGLEKVKLAIKKIKAYIYANKKSKNNLNIHLCFRGNPGTGKTVVARMLAKLFYEEEILTENLLVEASRKDLVGQYVGETPYITNAMVNNAMGGILFVDEAYSLIPDNVGFDYGHEAIATLLKRMEDDRGKFCVIFAGYKNEMDKLLDSNPGLKSRFQFIIDFDDYTREELQEIIYLMVKKLNYVLEPDALNKILDILELKRKDKNFANAREARTILEQVIMCQNMRQLEEKVYDNKIILNDVDKYIKDEKLAISSQEKSKILTGEEELENLIGLSNIKKTIYKVSSFLEKNNNFSSSLHMCFYGNPGTGKTEVARILSRILYDIKAIDSSKFIETDAGGLISEYVGGTAKKTHDLIMRALGGVLFIDEAYALSNSKYGEEAISTLVKDMEDLRGQICVIFAGYKNEMNKFLSINPGLRSRIKFEFNFEDYSREELSLISDLMLKKLGYTINSDAKDLLLDLVDSLRSDEAYANARTVRNIIDLVVLNQSFRTRNNVNPDFVVTLDDVKEYIVENDIKFTTTKNSSYNFYDSLKKDYLSFDAEVVDDDYLEQAVISISGEGSEGTGFIISKDGLCLTCNHCIINNGINQKARVIFNFRKRKIKTYLPFTVIKTDEKNDIALIKLIDENEFYFLALEDEDYSYKPLKKFIMAGFPFGGETFTNLSITDGKIASVNIVDNRLCVFANMFGKPGNSGSPVIDCKSNKVIGIFWGGISKGDEMINCFTPISKIIEILRGN